MAFGKDPKMLERVGSFQQRARSFTSRREETRGQRSGGGGGGHGARFSNQFKPSTTDIEVGRLIPGQYQIQSVDKNGTLVTETLEYMPFTEHYDGRTGNSSICSAGPFYFRKDKRDSCEGCDLHWSTREKDAKGQMKSRVSRREMYAFNWLDYSTFYKVEQRDKKTGAIKTNPQSGDPYWHWVKATGQYAGVKRENREATKGRLLHWSMGHTHYNALLEYDGFIGKSCTSCGTKDSIESVAWLCPSCNEPLIILEETELDPKEIQKLVAQEMHCNACNTSGVPYEYIECTGSNKDGSPCINPVRACIFDVDLSVKRLEGTGDSNATQLLITNWSAPCPIDPVYESIAKPMDLPKIFAPTPLEVQKIMFQSVGSVSPETAARPYRTPR